MDFSAIIDAAIRKEYRHPRNPSGAYPTSASIVVDGDLHGACPRELFYNSENKREGMGFGKHDDNTLFIFKRGNMYEDMITDLLVNTGIVIGNNIKFHETGQGFEHSILVSGEVDILTEDPDEPEDEAWVIEHKTYTNNYMSAKSLREKGVFHNPKYLLQLMIYLDLFPKRSSYAINGGQLVYTDCAKPGPENRFVFEITLNDEGELVWNGTTYPEWNVRYIYDAMYQAKEFIDMGELPPKGYDPDIKECDFETYIDKGIIYRGTIKKWEQGEILTVQHYGCSFCDYKAQCIANQTLVEFRDSEEAEPDMEDY